MRKTSEGIKVNNRIMSVDLAKSFDEWKTSEPPLLLVTNVTISHEDFKYTICRFVAGA